MKLLKLLFGLIGLPAAPLVYLIGLWVYPQMNRRKRWMLVWEAWVEEFVEDSESPESVLLVVR